MAPKIVEVMEKKRVQRPFLYRKRVGFDGERWAFDRVQQLEESRAAVEESLG